MFEELREKNETVFKFFDLDTEEPWLKQDYDVVYPNRLNDSHKKELFLSLINFAKKIKNNCNENYDIMQFEWIDSGLKSLFMSEDNSNVHLIIPMEILISKMTDEEITEYIVDFLKEKKKS